MSRFSNRLSMFLGQVPQRGGMEETLISGERARRDGGGPGCE